ncbi:hypothetical protein CA3LBN_001136 [Candidozyma haemuli]|uniref:FYVE-type domain-containing protein n=1 Tax=Candidozyma haemuli TaxID=45357 RepID=A0ABX8I391_9ASCO|nr:hypothetical protein CA3LBN_001136 [[Candida] haemuloni]
MSTFNVLRYSALGAGVLYGAVHRYNLESAVSEQHKAEEWKKQEKLIKEAKAEYARLHAPKDKPSSGAGLSLKTLEDPNVDFGKALESLVQKLEEAELNMTPISSKDVDLPTSPSSTTGETELRDNSEKLICPICDEDMVSLIQLNRHIDDSHTGKENETSVQKKTPIKKTLKLDLFDDSNGFGLSDVNGEAQEGTPDTGSKSSLKRAHWKQPVPGKPNYCSQKECKKLLNVRTGVVNCRKCVKLNNAASKDTLPQYDSYGVFARSCESCYFNKPSVKLGTQVNSKDLTESFAKIRTRKVAEKQSRRDVLQKRFIKLTNLMAENYLWHAEHRNSVFSVFNSPRPPYSTEEYLEKEKEIVGHENWQIDDEITHCPLCYAKFNFLVRKHHCRLCGSIVSDLAINSEDMSSMCSLQVPAGIFMKLLPTLNYPPHVINNWDTLVSLNQEKSRHASIFSFRCCKTCKDTLIPRGRSDNPEEASAIFATYDELLMLKMHISTSLPRYDNLAASGLEEHTDEINKLRTKLMKYLKDFEIAIENFKRESFRLDPTSKKYVPLFNPSLVTNVYKSTIVFLQDSLLHFKRINDHYQELEKTRLTGQIGELKPFDNNSEIASPSPVPTKPRLTKKQIRELREELMVVSEQKFLVEQQMEEAKRQRRFDEVSALTENVNELEKRKSELEGELGEFAFE